MKQANVIRGLKEAPILVCCAVFTIASQRHHQAWGGYIRHNTNYKDSIYLVFLKESSLVPSGCEHTIDKVCWKLVVRALSL